MKHKNKFIFGTLFILAGLNLAVMTGCVGYVGGGDPGYYGGVDGAVFIGGGRGWYGDHHDHAYVHPDFHGGHRR